MSQHDLDIANQGFPATRADINNALQALGSSNSGATAPSTTYANQLWYDTANNILKIRNEDNDAWISLLYLDQTNDAVAQFDVDNIRIDGNTISSTDTNGDITIDPNGTGDTILASGNVGIGTSSPASEISGSATALHISDSNVASLRLDNSTGASFEIYSGVAGQLAFADDATERMRIDSSGRLLINTTATVPTGQTSKLQVQGDGVSSVSLANTSSGAEVISIWNGGGSGTRYLVWFATSSSYSNVGSVTSNGSSTSYNTTSDHRLKENVADMTGAIARVKQLAPKRFNFIVDADTTVDGFLAHEAQTVVPEAVTGTHNEIRLVTNAVLSSDGKLLAENVANADWTAGKLPTTDDDGNAVDAIYPSDSTWAANHNEPVYQGIDQSKLVPLLTGALQEAIAKIESLETRVAALEA